MWLRFLTFPLALLGGLVLAGFCLVGLVIIAAGLGIEAWSLGIATVLTGIVSTAIGVVLGLSHLLKHRIRRIPI